MSQRGRGGRGDRGGGEGGEEQEEEGGGKKGQKIVPALPVIVPSIPTGDSENLQQSHLFRPMAEEEGGRENKRCKRKAKLGEKAKEEDGMNDDNIKVAVVGPGGVDWVEQREHRVVYGYNATRVMFCTGK